MPYLKYDEEPYMVVTDEGKLVWVLDAYTTSNDYPYSQETIIEYGGLKEKINYITAHLQKFSSLPQGVKEIKEKLGEYTSYDEIRFVFEAYKKHIPA